MRGESMEGQDGMRLPLVSPTPHALMRVQPSLCDVCCAVENAAVVSFCDCSGASVWRRAVASCCSFFPSNARPA